MREVFLAWAPSVGSAWWWVDLRDGLAKMSERYLNGSGMFAALQGTPNPGSVNQQLFMILGVRLGQWKNLSLLHNVWSLSHDGSKAKDG